MKATVCIVYEPCLLGKGIHLLPLPTIFIDSATVKGLLSAQAPQATGKLKLEGLQEETHGREW